MARTMKELADLDRDFSINVTEALGLLNDLKISLSAIRLETADNGSAYDTLSVDSMRMCVNELWEQLYEMRYGRPYSETAARVKGWL